ncbi:MAG: hypothetical protein FJW14_13470 [Acidimicrobiia bacterium]|nr:hypothetical protein [Acidimicrobiia bacterium]
MEELTTCAYELDADLRIIWVDARWSEFAIANHAPELASPPWPLGQSALACVADSTSAMLYERLFQRVLRTRTSIALPFRCDAPARRRYLNLVIEPRTPAGLRVETTLTRTEERPAVALLEPNAPRGGDLLRMCGWCKSVDVAGRWCEVEDAVAEMRMFERGCLPPVTHGICPQCKERVSRELEAM